MGFILQITLIWIAFLMLRCSTERGRRSLKGDIKFQHSAKAAHIAGGHLRGFMCFDLISFSICFMALIFVIFTRPGYEIDWPVKHALFACQVVYGFLSAPFFFLTLPLFKNALTHAIPTGYDEEGRCRRYQSPQKDPATKREEEEILGAQ